ncbi:hypothetical protein [uncultured Aquimarina sp.]|uniref:hypothetical protein n=1 Tax=uncultured Aquimarina sp. TaxID=575652 RepID=UPI002638ADEC|nr:hypothetical protein [uncultured Aquimarina sp.]
MDRQIKIKKLVLFLIKQKGNIDSSYFFNQIFTRLGIFDSVHEIIDGLSKEDLIIHKGYFDDNGKLFKNISLTKKGEDEVQNSNLIEEYDVMESEFDNFSFLKPIFFNDQAS